MVETAVVLTKQGLAKIAEATAEKPLKLEKFAVGDGNGKPITPTENFTKLINEKYRDYLNSKYADGNTKYPKLFSVIGHQFNGGAVDPKDGTFALPDALNRYLRGASKDKRVGFYEEDAVKKHGHGLDLQLETETFTINLDHTHNMDHQHNYATASNKDGNPDGGWDGGDGKRYWRFGDANATTSGGRVDTGGSSKPTSDSITVKIKHYTGNTIETGAEETRVKGILALTCIWYE